MEYVKINIIVNDEPGIFCVSDFILEWITLFG